MPNIMICGLEEASARVLRKNIDGIMEELGLAGQAVTSIVKMETKACDQPGSDFGNRQPFIRICSTDSDEIETIVKRFKERKLRMDLEWLLLGGFIPADEMQ